MSSCWEIRGISARHKAELDAWLAAAPVQELFHMSQDSSSKDAMGARVALEDLKRQIEELHRQRQESKPLRTRL